MEELIKCSLTAYQFDYIYKYNYLTINTDKEVSRCRIKCIMLQNYVKNLE